MLAKRDAAFAEQVDKSVAQRESILLSQLRESSKRSWRAAAWLLQTTVGGRFGGHVPTLEEEVESEAEEEAWGRVRRSAVGSRDSDSRDGRKAGAAAIRESMEALERLYERREEREEIGEKSLG
jgi:hypothetical protein